MCSLLGKESLPAQRSPRPNRATGSTETEQGGENTAISSHLSVSLSFPLAFSGFYVEEREGVSQLFILLMKWG